MKKTILAMFAAALLFTACGNKGTDVKLDNMDDTLSWVMGENIGNTLAKGTFFELDEELLLQAVRTTLAGGKQPIADSVYEEGVNFIMSMTYLKQSQEEEKSRANADSVQDAYFKNLEATNPNVKKHKSGFYYEVIKQGKGPNAKYAQRILFDYRSYLFNGDVYDQTYERRDPILHVVGEPMFPGLIEGFQLMNAGSIYRFYFPYQMLGNNTGSGSVMPFTPMIYDIELHELYND